MNYAQIFELITVALVSTTVITLISILMVRLRWLTFDVAEEPANAWPLPISEKVVLFVAFIMLALTMTALYINRLIQSGSI